MVATEISPDLLQILRLRWPLKVVAGRGKGAEPVYTGSGCYWECLLARRITLGQVVSYGPGQVIMGVNSRYSQQLGDGVRVRASVSAMEW